MGLAVRSELALRRRPRAQVLVWCHALAATLQHMPCPRPCPLAGPTQRELMDPCCRPNSIRRAAAATAGRSLVRGAGALGTALGSWEEGTERALKRARHLTNYW